MLYAFIKKGEAMSLEFITLTTIYLLALLSPGQDFFLILSTSLHHGYKKAWWSCTGIAFGNALYIFLAFLGHSFLAQSILFMYIQLAGALFLIYLGFLLLKAPKPTHTPSQNISKHSWKLFLEGCLSALLNPKNIIFYFSILFTIIPTQTVLHVKLFYAFWMLFLLLLWDGSVSILFGNQRAKVILPYLFWVQKGVGGVLLFFGFYEISTLCCS